LTPNERRVLGAFASGFTPYQQEAQLLMGLANRSSAARAVGRLEGSAIIERNRKHEPNAAHEHNAEDEHLRIVDPLLARWVRRHGGARLQICIVPHGGQFVVTVGPSLVFTRTTHDTIAEAVAEANRVASTSRGSDIMVYDTDDPNDLPDWATTS